MKQNASAALQAIQTLAPTKTRADAEKGLTSDSPGLSVAIKAVDEGEGLLIGILSKAGVRDREREMIPLHALKAATYQLVRDIGTSDEVKVTKNFGVNVNHARDAQGRPVAIKCDVVQAWIGYPMPDENACYVALRPHDPKIIEAAKAGHISGFSWEGPYRLKDAGT